MRSRDDQSNSHTCSFLGDIARKNEKIKTSPRVFASPGKAAQLARLGPCRAVCGGLFATKTTAMTFTSPSRGFYQNGRDKGTLASVCATSPLLDRLTDSARRVAEEGGRYFAS